jgi:hypothetical protein
MRNPLAGVRTYTDPIRRHIDCPACGRRVASISRRGIAGGALAAAAILRGALGKHLAACPKYLARENER